MTITFFSNFINHYQSNLSDCFYSEIGDDYTFVATEAIEESFKGYLSDDFSNCEYLLNSYSSDKNYNKAMQLAIESDVVIIGSAPDVFIKERLKANKLTFRYSERWFKKGDYQIFSPRSWWYILHNHTIYRNKNLYMLCASAFTANDVKKYFAYPEKCFKWGYFPKLEKIDLENILNKKRQDTLKLFWVARWIDWKHPEMVIQLAIELAKQGYNFHIEMAGIGPMQADLIDKIKVHNLQHNFTLLGVVKNEEILHKMQESNVFLLTSDRGEGWGAVVNEAMSNGCTVIAGHQIGCVPYLIDNGSNGLVFKSKSVESLVEQVEKIIKNRVLGEQLAKNAYDTISKVWNAKIAANNFLLLANSLIDNKEIQISEGPCSVASPTNSKF